MFSTPFQARSRHRFAVVAATVGLGVTGGLVASAPVAHAIEPGTDFDFDVVSSACADTLFWQPTLESQPGVSWRGEFELTLEGDDAAHPNTASISKSERGYDSLGFGGPFLFDDTDVSLPDDWDALGANPRLEVTWTYGLNDDPATTETGTPFTIPVEPWTAPTLTVGSGTAADPFIVSTSAQLDEMRCYGGTPTWFTLANDIDLAAVDNFLPLGDPSSSTYDMHGVIDGAGYTISNMTIDLPQSNDAAFVANAREFSMRQLTFADAMVRSYGSDVGVVVGEADPLVVFTDVNVTGGTVYANRDAGLFAGELEEFLLVRPSVDGNLVVAPRPYVGDPDRVATDMSASSASDIGGIVGDAENGAILGATVDVTITGETDTLNRLGGLIGEPDDEILVHGLDADIVIDLEVRQTGTTSSAVAGLFGDYGLDEGTYLVDSEIALDMTLTAPATGDNVRFEDIGGIAGYPEEGGVYRSSVTGSLTLDASAATGSVSIERIGGAFGRARNDYSPSLSETLVDVDVNIIGDATEVGALVGSSQSAQVTDVRVDGSVSISGDGTLVGGLIGQTEFYSSSRPSTILDTVIHRGTVDVGTEIDDVGTLFGNDTDFAALVSNTWWDSTINGETSTDRGLPGSPATSAQFGDADFLAAQGFDTDVWCVEGGAPAIATLRSTVCDVPPEPDPDPEPDPVPPAFNPVAPNRVLDTRATGPLAGGTEQTISIAGVGGVPADAASVALNVTAVEPAEAGFVSVYQCGGSPDTSNLNYPAGETVANAVIVGLDGDGDICVFTSADTQVLVDVFAWFTDEIAPVIPDRLLDTRAAGGPVAAGSTTTVPVAGLAGVPSDASAVVVNVTVVEAGEPGFATVYSCGSVPEASNVNYATGTTRASMVVTDLSADGELCVFSSGSAHYLVDVFAHVTGGFESVAPARLWDTRGPDATIDGRFAGSGVVPPGALQRIQVAGRGGIPMDASSAVLTLTAVEAAEAGFASVVPCDAPMPPSTSTLNYGAGGTVPNAVVAELDSGGGVCVYTSGSAHYLLDVSGWFPG